MPIRSQPRNPTMRRQRPTAAAATPPFQTFTWRLGTVLANLLARSGIGPIARLTTTGRITGRAHTVPVVPVDHAGKRWLVAPYGPVAWVHNARASNAVTLRHGLQIDHYAAREATPDEAGPVLKRYVQIAARARTSFTAPIDAPAAAFTAEAEHHPVFELIQHSTSPSGGDAAARS